MHPDLFAAVDQAGAVMLVQPQLQAQQCPPLNQQDLLSCRPPEAIHMLIAGLVVGCAWFGKGSKAFSRDCSDDVGHLVADAGHLGQGSGQGALPPVHLLLKGCELSWSEQQQSYDLDHFVLGLTQHIGLEPAVTRHKAMFLNELNLLLKKHFIAAAVRSV